MANVGVVRGLKSTIAYVVENRLNFHRIESVEWWALAVSNSKAVDGFLGAAPNNGETLLQLVLDNAVEQDEDEHEGARESYASFIRYHPEVNVNQRLDMLRTTLMRFRETTQDKDIFDALGIPQYIGNTYWAYAHLPLNAHSIVQVGNASDVVKLQILQRAAYGVAANITLDTVMLVDTAVPADVDVFIQHIAIEGVTLPLDDRHICTLPIDRFPVHENLVPVSKGAGYCIYLTQGETKSVMLLDNTKLRVRSMLGVEEKAMPDVAPRVYQQLFIRTLAHKDITTGESLPNVIVQIAVVDPIFGTLYDYVYRAQRSEEEVDVDLREVVDVLLWFTGKHMQHGNLSSRRVLRVKEGWFFLDYRSFVANTLHKYESKRGWLATAPQLRFPLWDGLCLFVDLYHEAIKRNSRMHKKLLDVHYQDLLTRRGDGSERMLKKAVSKSANEIRFVLRVGNFGVTVETYLIAAGGSRSEPSVVHKPGEVLKVPMKMMKVFVPTKYFSRNDLDVGNMLGAGTYGCVFALTNKGRPEDAAWVAKITTLPNERNNAEYFVQAAAARRNLAPVVHDYFTVSDYVTSDFRYKITHTNIVCIVMARYDITLHSVIYGGVGGVFSIDTVNAAVLSAFKLIRDFGAAGFMHRDLRCDNIMVKDVGKESMQTRVIDFGMARHENIHNVIRWDVDGPHDKRFVEDMDPTDLSWLKMPPLCPSKVYDLISLLVSVCYQLNVLWDREVEAERQRITRIWEFVVAECLDVVRDASSKDNDAAYIESLEVNVSTPETVASTTLVYVEKVGDGLTYRTEHDTEDFDMSGKRKLI